MCKKKTKTCWDCILEDPDIWPALHSISGYSHCYALPAGTGTPTVKAAAERAQLYCWIHDLQVKTDYVWLDRWWCIWPTICCILIAVSLGKGFHGNKPWASLICCFAALTHLEAGWIPFCQAHILLLYFLSEPSFSLFPSLSLALMLHYLFCLSFRLPHNSLQFSVMKWLRRISCRISADMLVKHLWRRTVLL